MVFVKTKHSGKDSHLRTIRQPTIAGVEQSFFRIHDICCSLIRKSKECITKQFVETGMHFRSVVQLQAHLNTELQRKIYTKCQTVCATRC
jgi:hypothetical protein